MENNLYYQPTIEELSINQEVYLLDTGNYKAEYTEGDVYPMLSVITQLTDYPTIWVRNSYNGKGFKTYEVYPDQIGLKFLDQSDIESLGWTFKTKGPFRTWYTGSDSWFNNTIPTGDSGRYWSFELSHDIKYNGIIIKAGTNYGDTDTFFEGTIKNKSELIKLMQQLNIK